MGNKSSDLSIYIPSLSYKHALNLKHVCSPGPNAAFEKCVLAPVLHPDEENRIYREDFKHKGAFCSALSWSTQIENVRKDLLNFIHSSLQK